MRGHVQRRLSKDGKRVSWSPMIDLGRDPATGARRLKRLPVEPTREAADLALADELVKLRRGEWTDPGKRTFGEFLDEWLGAVEVGLRESTVAQYETIARNHVRPALGAVPLGELGAPQIQACLRRQLHAGAAPSSVRQTHRLIRSALNLAVAWRLLPRNPSDGVRPPAVEEGEPAFWSAADARRFLDAIAEDRDGPLWRLALDAGLRIGELVALRWEDVDLQRGELRVRRTATRTRARGWELKDRPKSRAGKRAIGLLPGTVGALRTHRAGQRERRLLLGAEWGGAARPDADLVFDAGDGRPRWPNAVRERFNRLVDKSGLPRLTPHGLRHTMATLLLEAGVHPKVVQDRLGHATIEMVMRYSHLTRPAQESAVEALEEALDGAKGAHPRRRVTRTLPRTARRGEKARLERQVK